MGTVLLVYLQGGGGWGFWGRCLLRAWRDRGVAGSVMTQEADESAVAWRPSGRGGVLRLPMDSGRTVCLTVNLRWVRCFSAQREAWPTCSWTARFPKAWKP